MPKILSCLRLMAVSYRAPPDGAVPTVSTVSAKVLEPETPTLPVGGDTVQKHQLHIHPAGK